MTYEVNGRTLEATESGYLVNQDDWDKDVAQAIAAADGLTLTQDHWDVIEYLAKQPRHPQGHAGQVGGSQGGQQDAVRPLPGEPFEAGGQGRGAAGEHAEGWVLGFRELVCGALETALDIRVLDRLHRHHPPRRTGPRRRIPPADLCLSRLAAIVRSPSRRVYPV